VVDLGDRPTPLHQGIPLSQVRTSTECAELSVLLAEFSTLLCSLVGSR
jgi:hypothetical protein